MSTGHFSVTVVSSITWPQSAQARLRRGALPAGGMGVARSRAAVSPGGVVLARSPPGWHKLSSPRSVLNPTYS
jgi:hypothetical protein